MFYYLNGTLALREINTCVIDVNGVGYQLTVSGLTCDRLAGKEGKAVKLFTYLAVREDGVELFGFGSNEERVSFNRLTSVSGVGPKAAMAILSIMDPDKLALAICTEDVKAIAKAQGVGAKTAARIVLELKDKVSKEMLTVNPTYDDPKRPAAPTQVSGNLSEACEALMVLGYDKSSVMNALRGMDPALEVGEIIRAALKKLSR